MQFYEAQLDVLLDASRKAAASGDGRLLGNLSPQIAAARANLDDARDAEMTKSLRLDRTVPAVVAELERQRKAIDILVGAAGVFPAGNREP